MYVIKVEVDGVTGKVTESVIARDLPPLLARAKAKSLNDARDTGEEDRDESGLISYVARNL